MSSATTNTSRETMHFYNRLFRQAIFLSLVVALVKVFYPLLFEDAFLGFQVDGEVEIVKTNTLETPYLILFMAICGVNSVVWLVALFQLWGVSHQVKEERFFSEEMEKRFSRFAYCVFGMFLVRAIHEPVSGVLAYYLHLISDIPDVPVVAVFDFDILAASIFLMTASRIMSEAKQIHAESELTV